MISTFLLRNSSSEGNQIIHLYKDAYHTELFGWLCVYTNPYDANTIVEHWALVDKDAIDLYGVRYYPHIEPNTTPAPTHFDEWLKVLANGPRFQAFIDRLGKVVAYPPPTTEDDVFLEGATVVGIYNSAANQSGPQTLVCATLQQQVEVYEEQHYFEQVTLMSTLEAELPLFSYTDALFLPAPLTFDAFVGQGGVNELNIAKDKIAFVSYEKVFVTTVSPLAVNTPFETLQKPNGTK